MIRRPLRSGLRAVLVAQLLGIGTATGAHAQDAGRREAPADSAAERPTQPAEAAADTSVKALLPLRVRVGWPLVVGGASAFEVDLDSLAFLAPSPTLGELLREMPVLRVRENSRGETHLSLRGSEARQLPVLLDGVALTLGWDNRTDLSLIPLAGVRRVQTVRGLSSLLAGPNVLGGVMRLEVAREPFALAPVGRVRLGTALDDAGGGAVDAGVEGLIRAGGAEVLLRAGGGFRRRNDVPIPEEIVQPAPALPGVRLNSDFRQANGFLATRLQTPGGAWASLSSVAYSAERGVPPELHVEEPRLWRIPETSRWVTVLAGGTGWRDTGAGRGRLAASVGIDFGHTEIDVYESPAYESVVGGEDGDDRTLTFRLFADHTLGDGAIATAFTFVDTDHDEELDPGGAASFSQRLWSAAAEVRQPFGQRADGSGAAITVGGSLDGSDTPETGGLPPQETLWDWGAKLTGSVTLTGGATRLHVGVSRRTRFPSLRELYSGALGRFVPNPELGPEVLVVGEAGVTASGESWTLQGVAFHQRLTDAIVRTEAGDGAFRRVNRDRVLSTGVELLGSGRWQFLSASVDLTLQSVRLEDPAIPDERHAEYQPAVSGSFELGARLPAEIDARFLLDHIGRRYCVNADAGRDEELEADTHLAFQVWRDWGLKGLGPLSRLRALAGVDNLGNAVLFDQCGLPRPGRIFRLQIDFG